MQLQFRSLPSPSRTDEPRKPAIFAGSSSDGNIGEMICLIHQFSFTETTELSVADHGQIAGLRRDPNRRYPADTLGFARG